ncbi:Hypothetical protein KNT65_gp144 [Escherichia phage EcS1]|uniref:Uncharacterized protein n=1 Tax=Escherichia phage EcS1 TaxID=2083276 RepID=A0A2Z5ZCR1_9CAUD|nr:Hypothetical protein KNT65_gp144 [Escherichia phage EcS1]BBC78192.1 Hypothetical protein [Escherichia phage EcS1]
MIIETLYMYYRNSREIWKTEKFFLFLLCSIIFSTLTAITVYTGLETIFKVEDSGILVWSFIVSGFYVWAHWIYRWCWWVKMDSSCQVHSQDGWIGKQFKETKEAKKQKKSRS